MGLFSSKPPDDETSRRYLAVAPPGPRTEVLTAACFLAIAELPIAGAELLGRPVTVPEHDPVAALVRRTMRQDRDLSGSVARKAMQHLHVVFSRFMHGPSYGANVEELFAAAGLRLADSVTLAPELRAALPPVQADAAEALGEFALSVLRAFALGDEAGPSYRLYLKLYAALPGEEMEDVAYGIVAWSAIAFGRLRNAGRIRPGFPMHAPAYRHVPPMEAAGWYPNPVNTGSSLVSGDAAIQRYWDGEAWTDRVRYREGMRWRAASVTLHAPPVD